MKNLKKNQGITLIALVITIIVMLILVAVTITMAVNGGLFGYARNASVETKQRRDEELEIANIESGKSADELVNYVDNGTGNYGGRVENKRRLEDGRFTGTVCVYYD